MQIILGQWKVYSKGFVRERKGASTEELARREDACRLVRVDVDGHRVTQADISPFLVFQLRGGKVLSEVLNSAAYVL